MDLTDLRPPINSESRLLYLPLELRDMIYKEVFAYQAPWELRLCLHLFSRLSRHVRVFRPKNYQVLQVSKDVRGDASRALHSLMSLEMRGRSLMEFVDELKSHPFLFKFFVGVCNATKVLVADPSSIFDVPLRGALDQFHNLKQVTLTDPVPMPNGWVKGRLSKALTVKEAVSLKTHLDWEHPNHRNAKRTQDVRRRINPELQTDVTYPLALASLATQRPDCHIAVELLFAVDSEHTGIKRYTRVKVDFRTIDILDVEWHGFSASTIPV